MIQVLTIQDVEVIYFVERVSRYNNRTDNANLCDRTSQFIDVVLSYRTIDIVKHAKLPFGACRQELEVKD
jgi:hypothetical protein